MPPTLLRLAIILLATLAGGELPEWARRLPPQDLAPAILDGPCESLGTSVGDGVADSSTPGRQEPKPSDVSIAIGCDRMEAVRLAAGWPSLGDPEVAAEEIRVWNDTGIAYPMLALRLVKRGGRVNGELVGWWFAKDPDDDIRPTMDQFMAGQACRGRKHGEGVDVCWYCPPTRTDWARVWNELVELGVWELPDQKELVRSESPITTVADGDGVLVEISHSSEYRSYQYFFSSTSNRVEDRSAERIFDVVEEMRPSIQ